MDINLARSYFILRQLLKIYHYQSTGPNWEAEELREQLDYLESNINLITEPRYVKLVFIIKFPLVFG